MNTLETFKVKDKVCIITGGAGLLGKKHAEAVMDGEGLIVLLDINREKLEEANRELSSLNPTKEHKILVIDCDITNISELRKAKDLILNKFGSIDILINNAANNPKVEDKLTGINWTHFESFPMNIWNLDLAVGLTGAFLCCQVFGTEMAARHKGVILNVSSDLGIIAPDQRIYKKEGIPDEQQSVKPVTYSVVKHALIGLTKYLATYWARDGIRVNTICPGGVYNGQDDNFLRHLTNLIPMNRMATSEEYKSAVLFMVSDASSYMTGSTVIIDGGRTCW